MNSKNIVSIPLAYTQPVIIDAACFSTHSFKSAVANYAALFAICSELLRCEVTFMCLFPRALGNNDFSKRWVTLLNRFGANFPYWFQKTLIGSVVDEGLLHSTTFNARIVSARIRMSGNRPKPLVIVPAEGRLFLPEYCISVAEENSLEVEAARVQRMLLSKERYRRHIVRLYNENELETAA